MEIISNSCLIFLASWNDHGNSLIDIYFDVFRHLLNQSIYKAFKRTLLLGLWSFIALVLTSCFSGKFLSSTVIQNYFKINNIDELVNSELTIFDANLSWIWWQYDVEDNPGSTRDKELPHDLVRIRSQIKYDSQELIYTKVYYILYY